MNDSGEIGKAQERDDDWDALITTLAAFRPANQRCSNSRVEINELVEFLKRGGGLGCAEVSSTPWMH